MAAGITINGSSIGKALVGSSEVGKIYLGNVEVYSKASPGFMINVAASTGMDHQGYLTGLYGANTLFDYQEITYSDPVSAAYDVPIVAGQQLVIRYSVDHGYCSISRNGTQVHSGGQTGSYTLTPQLGDVIEIEWYFED